MKTIVLCRHAKSDWPLNVNDIDRPLKDRGIKDANRLGELLAQNKFSPDLIVSSPANRAISTARIIAVKLGYTENIPIDPNMYGATVGGLVSIIEELPQDADSAMLFGHNMTMEETVRYLAKMSGQFQMPTCGMACFESNAPTWELVTKMPLMLRWILVPRLARKKKNDLGFE